MKQNGNVVVALAIMAAIVIFFVMTFSHNGAGNGKLFNSAMSCPSGQSAYVVTYADGHTNTVCQ